MGQSETVRDRCLYVGAGRSRLVSLQGQRYLPLGWGGPGEGPIDHPQDGIGTGEEAKAVGKTEAHVSTATKAPPRPFTLRRDKEGWWIYGEHITPDVPWWGPWDTKQLAAEARDSYRRCNISEQRPCDIKSEWRNRRKLPGAK